VSPRPAVFLDRDGTLIEDRHYLRDPAEVRLLPGVGGAIRRLNKAGVAAVVVTNQSGIARGLLTEADYTATARRLDDLLAGAGARLDAAYHCPHLPEISGPCECRKPGLLLYRRAAGDLDLDLERSWWVGDRPRDVEAASALGGRGMLILPSADEEGGDAARRRGWSLAPDLPAAVRTILAGSL
jgi:D-glycero-D-manno-heptose 1,7-bisphosphate phosphatase